MTEKKFKNASVFFAVTFLSFTRGHNPGNAAGGKRGTVCITTETARGVLTKTRGLNYD